MDSILSNNKALAGLNALFRPNPFTIRARIVNFVGKWQGMSGFQENRDVNVVGYFKDNGAADKP